MKKEEALLLKNKIIDFAKSIGIAKIGFTNTEPLVHSKQYLDLREASGYRFNTNAGDSENKTNPLMHLPEAKSVIVVAVAYGRDDFAVGEDQEGLRGQFSKASWGRDYHVVIKGLLDSLADYIKILEPNAKTATKVDTGQLLEKSIAEKAGLGWIGKNSLLITPEYGSYVFLGLLLTDLPLPEDLPVDNSCGSCNCCLEHCPGQALAEPGNLNLDRCLANLTLYSEKLEEELKEKINTSLYGCDICQEVCPHNKKKGVGAHPDFRPIQEDVSPLLEDIMTMSNKEFKRRFGHMAGSWRGKRPILRNAILIAGNQKDKKLIPLLKDLVKHPHPDIRANATWALKKIEAAE